MTVCAKTWRWGWVVAVCLFALSQAGRAQKNAPAVRPEQTRTVLVEKAHVLEARGRPDMAVQLWQQILLSDPKNIEALVGIARDYRLIGKKPESDEAIERLRAVNPNDPNIQKIEALTSTRVQSDRLREAGELARQGKNDAAMNIYRQLYGDRPPDGDVALAYYQTLYGSLNGKENAVLAMRALAQRNPGDSRYSIELGRMLTYEGKTRSEGIRILKGYPKDGAAQQALRQALVWDSANPASAAELREYLRTHPDDTELTGHLKENETKLAQMNSGIARNAAERMAFAALNGHRLDEAETRFGAILEREPGNGRVAAGMGFLRMQQSNFGGAIDYLTQAEQNGYKAKAVEDALATSRFWNTMGEATQAFNDNQPDVAQAKFRSALEMRPHSPEALNGLAGVLTRAQQYSAAAGMYEQITNLQPGSSDAWRGLFLAYARDGQNDKALAVATRLPAGVRATLAKDPEYLRMLATTYQAVNRPVEAERTLAQALALPFPDNGRNLKTETRLQYASILVAAKRYRQAVSLYAAILNDDAGSVPAWMGLVGAHHEMGEDSEAIAAVQRMPPATYEASLSDPGFLSMLGSIYAQANQLELAESLIERAMKLQAAAGGEPGIPVQLQMAAIYLQQNKATEAYEIYRRLLHAHPDRVDAWKGLIAAMAATNRDQEAMSQIEQIPPQTRKQLEADIEFVQTEASVYAAVGDNAHAIECLNRVIGHYNALKVAMPANVEVQNAWLLFNTGNDRGLYPALMRLGGRADLTAAQREQVQDIWANWSVRRAAAAMENGDAARAVDILDAALQAFPDNMTVRAAVAGGYSRVGRFKESLALFKTMPLQDATVGDLQGAIGAALGANDKPQAEMWLREALERYPHSPSILALAARYEQTRGDNQRAADYWRASLAAMPEASPTDRLAHTLVYPDQDAKARRANTPADLQHLLDPEYEPFPKTTKLPPLPAYGRDPYTPGAPVDLTQTAPAERATQPASQHLEAQPVEPRPEDRLPVDSRPSAQGTGVQRDQQAPRFWFNTPPPAGGSGGELPPPPPQTTPPPVVLRTQPVEPAQRRGSAPSGSAQAQRRTPPLAPELPQSKPVQPAFIEQKATRSAAPTSSRWQVQTGIVAHDVPDGLRIGAQQMSDRAARVQALMTEQTDSQLMKGVATTIGDKPTVSSAGPSMVPGTAADTVQYNTAQYTPSAQEAATGAFSAPRAQNQQTPVPTQHEQPTTQQKAPKPAATKTGKRTKRAAAAQPATAGEPEEKLENVPASPKPEQGQVEQTSADSQSTSGTGLSDDELQQRSLPPLRGPWIRVKRQQRPINPRDEAETQLRSIESGYSAWLGGSGVVNYRSGSLGFDQLAALDAPFEASLPMGYNARFTIVARPIFLDSGQANGNSLLQVTTLGQTKLMQIPNPLGTLLTTDTTPPPQQNSAGLAGEVQLSFPHLSVAGGYMASGFLVSTFTARGQWRPANGPITISVVRDPVKDSQLSYSGLRDPGSASLSFPGNIWGGVMANQGNINYGHGDAESGFYMGVGGQYLKGYNVQTNYRVDGDGGAYWRVLASPENGSLTVGVNFFAMHYAHNQQAYTYGMGGYFSPSAYFLGNVPLTWTGHSGTRWHYTVLGSLGVQAFQTQLAALFPLPSQTSLEVSSGNLALPAMTSVGPNYDLRGSTAYQIGPHWFTGGFLSANNSRNYSAVSAGFFVRYLFRSQPSTVTGPTGLFPTDGLRPFTVP